MNTEMMINSSKPLLQKKNSYFPQIFEGLDEIHLILV